MSCTSKVPSSCVIIKRGWTCNQTVAGMDPPFEYPQEHPRMMQVRTLSPTTAGFGLVRKK